MDLREYEKEVKSLHDRMVGWCNFLLAFIGKEIGEEAVGRAMGELVEEIYKERFMPLKKMTPKERFENIRRSHIANWSEIETEEDDKSYRIIVKTCGSGGLVKREGWDRKYGALTSKGYPWNFGKPGVPYYCSHGSYFNDLYKKLGLKIDVMYDDRYCVYTISK
jgi:hypothetical protein